MCDAFLIPPILCCSTCLFILLERNNFLIHSLTFSAIFSLASFAHKHTNAQGVVAFSSQGDRIALTQIEQMIDGKYVILGHYDVQADNLSWTGLEKWQGNKVIKSTEVF